MPSNDTDTPLPANLEYIACVLLVVVGIVGAGVVLVGVGVAVGVVVVTVGAVGLDVEAAALLHAMTPAAIKATAAKAKG